MPTQPESFQGPHQGQPLLVDGPDLADAQAALIMVHGRGAGAADILTLRYEIAEEDKPHLTLLAPQANQFTWYPNRFMAPLDDNEPWLSSGLVTLNGVLDHVLEAGLPAEKVMWLGFSQGACLALEFVARNAQRYGAVFGFSGGLIGPPGTPRDYAGSLDGTPVFLGCSDSDPHIPAQRVHETADVLTGLGAEVETQLYPNAPHSIIPAEIEAMNALIQRVLAEESA